MISKTCRTCSIGIFLLLNHLGKESNMSVGPHYNKLHIAEDLMRESNF